MAIRNDTECERNDKALENYALTRDCLQSLLEIGLLPGYNLVGEICQRASARILVVEDECIIATHLECSLADFGYEVAGMVRTGREAIEIAMKGSVDLVLMDVYLDGDMDGIEAASAIQSQLDVAIVYLTGSAFPSTMSRAQETYPYGFVFKPFSEKDLKAVIEVALQRFNAERRLKRCANLFRQLFGASPFPMILHRDNTILIANSAAAQSVGAAAPEELVGQSLSESLPLGRRRTAPVKRGEVMEVGGEICPNWEIVPLRRELQGLAVACCLGPVPKINRRSRT